MTRPPASVAATLAGGSEPAISPVVGLCVPHAAFRYFVALSSALETLAGQDGYDMLHVFSRLDGKTELHRIQMLLRHQISGLLLLPSTASQQTLDWLADAELPTVVLDRPIDDRRFDQVTVDMRSAMRQAGSRLIALGHRRLLLVTGNPRPLVSQRRVEGLRQAIRESGHRVALTVLERSVEKEDAVARQLTEVMQGETRPTAIISTNTVAVGWIVTALRRLALQVPQQVSLLAADEPEWAGFVQPALSVIHAPARAVATQAWSLLRARIQGHGGRPRRIGIDPELRLTGSIGPAPLADLPPGRPARREPR